jgi:hypothetical protein
MMNRAKGSVFVVGQRVGENAFDVSPIFLRRSAWAAVFTNVYTAPIDFPFVDARFGEVDAWGDDRGTPIWRKRHVVVFPLRNQYELFGLSARWICGKLITP